MRRIDYVIGIDPDCEKSGVAIIDARGGRLKYLASLSFPMLIDTIMQEARQYELENARYMVAVEAGWMISNHWHVNPGDSKQLAATKGNAVGRNHETGRKIVEMLQWLKIPVQEIRPLRKGWSGNDKKVTHDELQYFIPGMPGRSNQEERDAILMAWTYAGLPVKMAPKKTDHPGKPGKKIAGKTGKNLFS